MRKMSLVVAAATFAFVAAANAQVAIRPREGRTAAEGRVAEGKFNAAVARQNAANRVEAVVNATGVALNPGLKSSLIAALSDGDANMHVDANKILAGIQAGQNVGQMTALFADGQSLRAIAGSLAPVAEYLTSARYIGKHGTEILAKGGDPASNLEKIVDTTVAKVVRARPANDRDAVQAFAQNFKGSVMTVVGTDNACQLAGGKSPVCAKEGGSCETCQDLMPQDVAMAVQAATCAN